MQDQSSDSKSSYIKCSSDLLIKSSGPHERCIGSVSINKRKGSRIKSEHSLVISTN